MGGIFISWNGEGTLPKNIYKTFLALQTDIYPATFKQGYHTRYVFLIFNDFLDQIFYDFNAISIKFTVNGVNYSIFKHIFKLSM